MADESALPKEILPTELESDANLSRAELEKRYEEIEPRSAYLELTSKRKAFIEEYLVDLNAKQAAIRAGYAKAGAHVEGIRLLNDVNVRREIDTRLAQRASRVKISQETILNEMSVLALSTLEHYYIDDNGQVKLTEDAPRDAMRAIQSIKRKKHIREDTAGNITITYEVEIRLWNKPEPLKLLGKHVGLKWDRIEVTGRDGGPIEVAAKQLSDLTPEQLQLRAQELAAIVGKIEEPKMIEGEVVNEDDKDERP